LDVGAYRYLNALMGTEAWGVEGGGFTVQKGRVSYKQVKWAIEQIAEWRAAGLEGRRMKHIPEPIRRGGQQ